MKIKGTKVMKNRAEAVVKGYLRENGLFLRI